MSGLGVHKILRIFAEAKLSDKIIDYSLAPIEIIRQAEEDKCVHRFKKDIYFCAYKTTFEEKPSIILVFTMKLPGPITGSSASSEFVMELVNYLEKILMPIDHMNFSREVELDQKNIGTLIMIKKIREYEDIV